MTSRDHALLAAHQAARQAHYTPGDPEYQAMLDRVAETMQEPRVVRVGDHTPEPRR